MPRKGGRRKKSRTHVVQLEEEGVALPKSFVFCQGKVADTLRAFCTDMRRVMEPHTASRLRSRRAARGNLTCSLPSPLSSLLSPLSSLLQPIDAFRQPEQRRTKRHTEQHKRREPREQPNFIFL